MARVALAALVGAAFAVLTASFIGCGGQGAGYTDQGTSTPRVDTSEVEAVASAFVEIAGTFDYRDQESQYQQLQPLLADKTHFQEDPNAVSTQRVQTSRAVATRVDTISDNDAVITVTADYSRSYIPYQSSQPAKVHLLQQVDCRLVLEEGQWLVSRSMVLSEQPLPQDDKSTPVAATPSGAVSTVLATDGDEIRGTIRTLVLNRVDPRIKDEEVGGQTYYADSSGTQWVGFTAFAIPVEAADPSFGVMKKTSGGNWELLFVGTGPVGDALPDDVKNGLGIDW
ncbi:MAG: hypothetical protein ABSC13_02765 [Dehalococcoidia bacterium]|jgi:hypothetical protein